MENRKPNVLLTVALVLMVLAALVCLIVFLSTGGSNPNPDIPDASDPPLDSDSGDSDPQETESEPASDPTEPETPTFNSEGLQADLDDCLDGLTSSWQVTVIDLASGTTVNSTVNCKEDEKMVAADLTKLFIMATAYDQVNAGTLTETQIDSYLTQMIRDDNAEAGNSLTRLLGSGSADDGRAAVTDFALSIGCSSFEFNRLFGESGTQNYVSSSDCATLLRLIAQGLCVSDDASLKMMMLLTGTEGARIPGGVPEDANVAHLNANITGTCCADVGIVSLGTQEFVIAIVCNNPFTNEGATSKCVEITKLVCSYYVD